MFILRKTCTCSFIFLSCIYISRLVAGRTCLILTLAILFQYRTHNLPLLMTEDIGCSQFLSIRHVLIVVAFNELAVRCTKDICKATPDQRLAQWHIKHPVTFMKVHVFFTSFSLGVRENREILTCPCVF